MIKCNLSEFMGKFKLTMKQVSKETKINKNTISNLYHDTIKRVDYDTLNRLCKYFKDKHNFDCQVNMLLEYVPDEEQKK